MDKKKATPKSSLNHEVFDISNNCTTKTKSYVKNIISLDYNGFNIHANNSAWFNATDIAAIFNKKPIHWLKLPETEKYINALCKKLEVRKSHFVRTYKGGTRQNQGTWLHRKLAISFARWCDINFAIWCDEQIESIITNTQSWQHTRQSTSVGYKVMCDVLKDTREAIGKNTMPYHYSNEALLCNEVLTGKREPLNRDLLPKNELRVLDRLEIKNIALIALKVPLNRRKVILTNLAHKLRLKQSKRRVKEVIL